MSKRPYHHGDLRQALVTAAHAIVSEDGIEHLTLRKVAARAGVSHASPAHHVGNLNGLLAALAEEGFGKLRAHTERALARHPAEAPVLQLKRIGEAYVTFAAKEPAYFRAMFHPALADKTPYPALHAASTYTFDHLLDAIRAGQAAGQVRAGEPRQIGLMLWTAAHGVASFLIDGQLGAMGFRGSAAALAETLTGEMYLGLRPA